MNIQTSKIELAKLILSIDNPNILQKILEVVQMESTDFGELLSPTEKEEIQMALNQLNLGKRISYSKYRSKLS